MSSDKTSHPGRPGYDELVPSRYALRVGEIDVLVVSDGVLSLPGAMLAHNADPAVRAAWLNDMFLPPDVLERALNVVVCVAARSYARDDAPDHGAVRRVPIQGERQASAAGLEGECTAGFLERLAAADRLPYRGCRAAPAAKK